MVGSVRSGVRRLRPLSADSAATTIKGFSTNTQDGTQDPVEEIYVPGVSAAGDLLVVALYSGSTRALHLDTERGVLAIQTAGATIGHNAGLNTVSMAATAWNSARVGTKPFTGPANKTEVFSSDGPRKITPTERPLPPATICSPQTAESHFKNPI